MKQITNLHESSEIIHGYLCKNQSISITSFLSFTSLEFSSASVSLIQVMENIDKQKEEINDLNVIIFAIIVSHPDHVLLETDIS